MNRAAHYHKNPDEYYAGDSKKVALGSGLSRRFIDVLWVLILGAVLLQSEAFATSPLPATRPELASTSVAALIANLGSDDASVREAASAKLIATGNSARAQILQAIRSDDPGLREEAAEVLLALPWSVPTDPDAVKKLLDSYGLPEILLRREKVFALVSLENGAGIPALLRLLREEPSPEVRWTIVRCLRVNQHEAALEPFRTAEPEPDDPQVNELCGYARLMLQLPKATDYLRHCAEIELAHPTDDGGEFDFVIQQLANADIQQKNYTEAADWRRRELARGGPVDEDGNPTALLELFALQANFGPIAGLQQDLQRADNLDHQPKLLYCLSKLHERQGQPDLAAKEREAAFNGSVTRQARYEIASFLIDHGWNDLAEREDRKFLQMETAGNVDNFRILDEDVHFQLASLAVARGDDETAAHEQETALRLGGDSRDLEMVDEQGREFTTPASEMWAEIHWRYRRAAISRHDTARAEDQLQQLLALKPTSTDIAIDLVPELKQKHRDTEAAMLFDSSYNALKSRVDADPHDPDSLNAIAWLCGNCGEHLDQAEQWATAAVAVTPGNAAVIDTLATVNYAEGKFAEAVKLETHASSLDPADTFMQGQLEKFKKAAAGGNGK
jgi:hypothetical protein